MTTKIIMEPTSGIEDMPLRGSHSILVVESKEEWESRNHRNRSRNSGSRERWYSTWEDEKVPWGEGQANDENECELGISDEELDYFGLIPRSQSVRDLTRQRNRSLINTLRYLHRGSRSNSNLTNSKDWGFLALKWKKKNRWSIGCLPRPGCTCCSTTHAEELDHVRASQGDKGFREVMNFKAINNQEMHSWQHIKQMRVDVVENFGRQKELELYLHKHQLTLYEDKIKPRYTMNLKDVESVSYLKSRLSNTDILPDSESPQSIKGIVLTVKERGCIQIACQTQTLLERLAVALRTNELLMNDPTVPAACRDHPIEQNEKSIMASQFQDKVRSGDILLFKTDNLSGKVIRKFTAGDWDHIALCFNFANGKCGILESLQNTGVAAFLWDDLLKSKAHVEYKKVAVRPLLLPRHLKKHILKKIERFIYEASQSKLHYGLEAAKWLRKKSVMTETWDEQRTYFCSELVAKCLKRVGLLRPNPASCQYLPCDFSGAKSIELLEGCNFGEEVVMRFDDVEK